MGRIGNRGSQRTNTGSGTGRKQRSPTSTSHKGSRVEPSAVRQARKGKRAPKPGE
ncbi:MAG: hypothetical protein JNM80_02505 [Phycisphaerae bacterium]|nr:hypothetical protein [Phycisphaerae bacterium]